MLQPPDQPQGSHARNRQRLRNVLLVGLSGAGKSCIGAALARRLGFGFVDLDVWIEQRFGKTIPAIFAEDGEAHFRALELQALEELQHTTRYVVSLGGGTLTSEPAWQRGHSLGLIVWRNPMVRIIARRLAVPEQLQKRPMFADLLEEADLARRHEIIEGRLFAILNKRQPWYERSDIIDTESFASIDDTASALARIVRPRLDGRGGERQGPAGGGGRRGYGDKGPSPMQNNRGQRDQVSRRSDDDKEGSSV